jgi:hypothetical protein
MNVFWDVAPCSLVEIAQRFRGTSKAPLKLRPISMRPHGANNSEESSSWSRHYLKRCYMDSMSLEEISRLKSHFSHRSTIVSAHNNPCRFIIYRHCSRLHQFEQLFGSYGEADTRMYGTSSIYYSLNMNNWKGSICKQDQPILSGILNVVCRNFNRTEWGPGPRGVILLAINITADGGRCAEFSIEEELPVQYNVTIILRTMHRPTYTRLFSKCCCVSESDVLRNVGMCIAFVRGARAFTST